MRESGAREGGGQSWGPGAGEKVWTQRLQGREGIQALKLSTVSCKEAVRGGGHHPRALSAGQMQGEHPESPLSPGQGAWPREPMKPKAQERWDAAKACAGGDQGSRDARSPSEARRPSHPSTHLLVGSTSPSPSLSVLG